MVNKKRVAMACFASGLLKARGGHKGEGPGVETHHRLIGCRKYTGIYRSNNCWLQQMGLERMLWGQCGECSSMHIELKQLVMYLFW